MGGLGAFPTSATHLRGVTQNRDPKGVPTGGRFAGQPHAEVDIELSEPDLSHLYAEEAWIGDAEAANAAIEPDGLPPVVDAQVRDDVAFERWRQAADGRDAEIRATDWATVDREPAVRVEDLTPWGKAYRVEEIAPGIARFHASGVSGIKLSPARNAMVHPALRMHGSFDHDYWDENGDWQTTHVDDEGGWYEGDAHLAAVAISFPDEFPPWTVVAAERVAQDEFPDQYEEATGDKVAMHHSRARRLAKFEDDHSADYVATSARRSRWDPAIMEVTARIGGDSVYGAGEEAKFIVPVHHYEQRLENPDGLFVIDTEHHQCIG